MHMMECVCICVRGGTLKFTFNVARKTNPELDN